MSDPPSGSDLDETLVNLVHAITGEVLLRQPNDLLDCCASFLERKLRERDGYRVHEDDRKLAKLRMCHLEDIERTSECSTSGENKSTGDTDKKKNVHLDCDNTNSVDVDKLRNKSDTSESGDSSDRNKPNAEKSGHDAEKLTNRKKHHVGSAKTPLNRFSRKTAESGGKSKSNSKYLDNFDSLGNEDEYQTVSKEDKIPPLPPTVCDNKKKRDDKKKRGDFDNNRTSVVAEIHAVDSELLSKRRTSHGSDSNISSASELGASASHPTPGVFFPQYDGDSASDPRAPSPSQEYIQTLSGHRNIVTHCHVLERYIVSSSLDCTVRVWDRRDGQMLEILNCGKPVHCIQCVTVQDGEVILFTALDIGKVLAWKLLTNHALEVKRVAEYSGHLPNPIRAMDVSGDNATMATGCCFTVNQINPQRGPRESVRGTVKLWELSSMLDDCVRDDGHFTDKPPKCAKTMHQLMTHTLRTRAPSDSDVGLMPLEEAWWGIRALLFTPDASRLVIGFGHPDDEELYDEGLLAVCSAETLETLWVQDRRMCQVTSLHFQPVAPDDSQDFDTWQMVVGTQNCLSKVTLVFIEKKTVDVIYHWTKFLSEDNFGVRYSPHGDYVISAVGNSVCFWDLETGNKLKELTGHTDQISFVSFSPDGGIICTASDDHNLMLWQVPATVCGNSTKGKGRKFTKRRSSELLAHGINRRNQKKTITY